MPLLLLAPTPTRSGQQDKRKERPLRVLNINFRSVSAKRAEIPNLLESLKPDIVLGTETWLDPTTATAKILSDSYKVYRGDRGGRGGGVLIAVRNSLDSYVAPDLEVDDCELLWVRIGLRGRRTLYVCTYYRPDAADEPSLIKRRTSLQRASRLPNAHLLIGGDFNLPGWDWNTNTMKPRSPPPRMHHDFLSMVCDNGLEQLVKEPTREDNTLDLFQTNCPQLVPRVEVVPGISDHSIPYCEISTNARRKKQTQRQIPLYSKADWDSLRTVAIELSADLQRMDGVATTEELWTTFRASLHAAVKKFIPHKTARPKTCQPWVTTSIRKLINRRDRTYRKMKKTGSEDLRTEVKNLRRTVQRQLGRSYWNYLNTVFTGEDTPDQAGKNKRFWSYIKY